MIVFVKKPTWRGWRSQLLRGYLPGVAISLSLIWFLRRFDIEPATRLFLANLPIWFCIALTTTLAGPAHPWPTRITRSAAFALAASLMMFAIASTNGGRH
jgi:peptidoglycan/LPS O-acetylase OafA/YrhL